MATHVSAVLCSDLNLIRCFDGTGIPIALIGSDPHDLVFQTRCVSRRIPIADPRTQPDRALDDLLAIGKSLSGRPALMFDNEPTMLIVSRNRGKVAKYFRFLLPDADLVEDMASKLRFEQLVHQHHLPVPRTVLSSQVDSADKALEHLSPPCIFKPVSHVGWYDSDIVREEGDKPFKALLAADADQFRRRWERMSRYTPDFVAQEYIPGNDDCIYSFHAYYNANSRPLGWFVGRKIRTYPKRSGVSTCLELVKEPRLVELSLGMLARMRYIGPIKLDFKRHPDTGDFYLLEGNTRFTLWNHLGATCGVNLPYLAWLDLLYGQSDPPSVEYLTGVKWLAFGNDFRAFVRDYRPEGDLSWAQWLASLRGPRVYNVFSWRDPRPFTVAAGRYLKAVGQKFARRLLRSRPPAAPAPEQARDSLAVSK